MKTSLRAGFTPCLDHGRPDFAAAILRVLVCGFDRPRLHSGGLGEAAIAGVGAAGNTGFVVSALTQVVSAGTLAAVSHSVGRKDQAAANSALTQSRSDTVGPVRGVLPRSCSPWCALYTSSVAADQATVEAGTTYLRWFMPALALQFAMLAMSSALRGNCIVRPTMYVQVLTVTINII